MTTHTPGPWVADSDGWIVSNDADFAICLIDGSRSFEEFDPQDKANARLIIAAPDLLGELKRMVEHFEVFANDHADMASTETWSALHCAKAIIRAAEATP